MPPPGGKLAHFPSLRDAVYGQIPYTLSKRFRHSKKAHTTAGVPSRQSGEPPQHAISRDLQGAPQVPLAAHTGLLGEIRGFEGERALAPFAYSRPLKINTIGLHLS